MDQGEKVFVYVEPNQVKEGTFVAYERDKIVVSIPNEGLTLHEPNDVLTALEYAEYISEVEDAQSIREDWDKLAESGMCSRRCTHFGGRGGCFWMEDGRLFCENYESNID